MKEFFRLTALRLNGFCSSTHSSQSMEKQNPMLPCPTSEGNPDHTKAVLSEGFQGTDIPFLETTIPI